MVTHHKTVLHYWNSSTTLLRAARGFFSKPGPTQHWTPSCNFVCFKGDQPLPHFQASHRRAGLLLDG